MDKTKRSVLQHTVGREALRQSCWRVIFNGWATARPVGRRWECTITELGKQIAENRIPFKLLRPAGCCSKCRQQVHAIPRTDAPRVILCKVCSFLSGIAEAGYAAPDSDQQDQRGLSTNSSLPQSEDQQRQGTAGKTVWVGPNQLSLLRSLNQAQGAQFRSLRDWILNSPEFHVTGLCGW